MYLTYHIYSINCSPYTSYLLLNDLATGATATDVTPAMCGPEDDNHTASVPDS